MERKLERMVQSRTQLNERIATLEKERDQLSTERNRLQKEKDSLQAQLAELEQLAASPPPSGQREPAVAGPHRNPRADGAAARQRERTASGRFPTAVVRYRCGRARRGHRARPAASAHGATQTPQRLGRAVAHAGSRRPKETLI